MNRSELGQLIKTNEKKFERNKLKRFAYTVLFYAAVFAGIEYFRRDLSLLELAEEYVFSIILAIPFVILSSVVFHQLFSMSQSEENNIKYLKQKLAEMERYEKELL